MEAGVEVGGRWDKAAYSFFFQLAKAKARDAPSVLRRSLAASWLRKWTGMLAFVAHDAYAASLVEEMPADSTSTDGPVPTLGDVLLSA